MAWQLSEAARRASDATPSSAVPYTGGGPWDAANCVTEATLPAHVLRLVAKLRREFPWIRSIGNIRCEPWTPPLRAGETQATRRPQQMGMHAMGRALDVMVPQLSGPEGLALANWLVQNAAALGLQLVIWDRSVWQGSKAPAARFSAYTGARTHTDHVHVEVGAQPGPLLRPTLEPIAPITLAFIRSVMQPPTGAAARTTPAPASSSLALPLAAAAGLGLYLFSRRRHPAAAAVSNPAGGAGVVAFAALAIASALSPNAPAAAVRVMRY